MKKVLILLMVGILTLSILTGCEGKKEVVVDINTVHEAVKNEMGEFYYPDRDIEITELKDYTGLSEDQIEAFIAQSPMITMGVDTFIVIKASDGNGDAVFEGLEKYRTFLVEESFQYPMNLPKVNAAKTVQYGDYSFFIMLGAYNDSIEDSESDEAREYYESEVERVEKVIEKFFE